MSQETKEGQYHYQTYSLREQPLAPVADRMYSGLALAEEGSILDGGGGDGRIPLQAPRPRRAGFLVVDKDSEAIRQCREAILQDGRMDEAVVGDITRLTSLPEAQNRQFRGAVSWRVIHSLTPDQQGLALHQVRQILPVGAPLFVAVASETDWKAGELQKRGYVADGLNDCGRIMGLQRPFLVHFFNQESLVRLLVATGFRVEEIAPFQEATGYKALKPLHPINDYLYAHAVRI